MAAPESANPFAAYEGDEVEMSQPPVMAEEYSGYDYGVTEGLLILVAALLIFIASRHKSK